MATTTNDYYFDLDRETIKHVKVTLADQQLTVTTDLLLDSGMKVRSDTRCLSNVEGYEVSKWQSGLTLRVRRNARFGVIPQNQHFSC